MGTARIPIFSTLLLLVSSVSIICGQFCSDNLKQYKCDEDCTKYNSPGLISNQYKDCIESKRLKCCQDQKPNTGLWVLGIFFVGLTATIFILIFINKRKDLETLETPNTATTEVSDNDNVAPTAPDCTDTVNGATLERTQRPPLRSVTIMIPVNPIPRDDNPPSYDDVVR